MTWSQVWAVWLGLVGGSFGVLEGLALSISRKDTLSDTSWSWLRVVPGQGIEHWTLPHVLAVVVLIGLCLVLLGHIGLGLWR
jgi:hypothetical protein